MSPAEITTLAMLIPALSALVLTLRDARRNHR